MSSSKNGPVNGLCAGVYLYEAQNLIPRPPLHTVYVYTVYFFTKGGGGVEPERKRLEGQHVTKLCRKYKHY
jgi:hypothetical protein